MKSSPLVQLLESFFVFFLFLMGGVLLIIGMEPERTWKLTQWIESAASHSIWLGLLFIGLALFLSYGLVRLYSHRYLELKLFRSRGKVEIEPTALKTLVMEFWRTQTDFPIPTHVYLTSGGMISITAKAPFAVFSDSVEEEDKKALLSFEKNLLGALERQLGYHHPVILRWILPSAGNKTDQDILQKI